MSNPGDRLAAWILAHATSEPPLVRAQLYRDAAETLASSATAPLLLELAREIENADQLHRELALEFSKGAGPAEGQPPSSKEDV